MFAGNNFTLTGAMELAGPCPTFYAYGQSIQGCDDGQATFIGAGGGTFVLKGAGQRSIFINEGELFFSHPPASTRSNDAANGDTDGTRILQRWFF